MHGVLCEEHRGIAAPRKLHPTATLLRDKYHLQIKDKENINKFLVGKLQTENAWFRCNQMDFKEFSL